MPSINSRSPASLWLAQVSASAAKGGGGIVIGGPAGGLGQTLQAVAGNGADLRIERLGGTRREEIPVG